MYIVWTNLFLTKIDPKYFKLINLNLHRPIALLHPTILLPHSFKYLSNILSNNNANSLI